MWIRLKGEFLSQRMSTAGAGRSPVEGENGGGREAKELNPEYSSDVYQAFKVANVIHAESNERVLLRQRRGGQNSLRRTAFTSLNLTSLNETS